MKRNAAGCVAAFWLLLSLCSQAHANEPQPPKQSLQTPHPSAVKRQQPSAPSSARSPGPTLHQNAPQNKTRATPTKDAEKKADNNVSGRHEPQVDVTELRPGYDPDDPQLMADAPAPPTLPDLTHRGLAASFSLVFSSITPPLNADVTSPVRVVIENFEGEVTVANRRWYVGFGHSLAQGGTLSGEKGTAFFSNPEVWGRGLWASGEGIAYGGGMGLVIPLIDHSSERGSVKGSMRVVQPWEYPRFAGRVLALRPFMDVRILDTSVQLQLRQGLDVMYGLRSSVAQPDTTLAGRTTLYLGYRALTPLGVGLELSEVYVLQSTSLRDEDRAVFSVSPTIRWMFSVLQPCISALFPIGRPLLGSASNYWAVRLTLGVVADL